MISLKNMIKFMIIYMIGFMIISTLFIMYTLQNIRTKGNNLILQNIMCNFHEIKKPHGRGSVQVDNVRLKSDFNNPFKSDLETDNEELQEINNEDVNEVLKSLKNNLFTDESRDYKSIFQYYGHSKDHDFKQPLSIHSGVDHNILHTLFPIGRPVNSPNEDRIKRQLLIKLKHKSSKLIVVLFKSKSLSTHALHTNKCQIKSCTFTHDEKLLEKANAVIFANNAKRVVMPKKRRKQVWIYSNIESPQIKLEIQEQMNWTATYRTDSTIVTPYAKFVAFANYTDLPSKPLKDFASLKTKVAAIFVSNCDAFNGRMEYVRELKKYVKIDVYGDCGDLNCSRKNARDCFDILKRDYKFYLAFENSNCRDYITEKLFVNALQNDVIPIVMGAHPEDYRKLAPPHSYIHVDDFDSPRQLAEYMNILDNNNDLYNSYFRWKGTGELIDTKFVCRLCSMLQIAPNFPMWYTDINKWWNDKVCILPNKSKGDRWSTWKNNQTIEKETIDALLTLRSYDTGSTYGAAPKVHQRR